jgi:gluconate 5-dehydrogenase
MIVNIGSVQSMLARQTLALHSAINRGLAMLTNTKGRCSPRGWPPTSRFGIQVNAISPGYSATETNSVLRQDDEFSHLVVNRTPGAAWGRVEEPVGTLVSLCSDAAASSAARTSSSTAG